jgi:hypothetical protein
MEGTNMLITGASSYAYCLPLVVKSVPRFKLTSTLTLPVDVDLGEVHRVIVEDTKETANASDNPNLHFNPSEENPLPNTVTTSLPSVTPCIGQIPATPGGSKYRKAASLATTDLDVSSNAKILTILSRLAAGVSMVTDVS